MDRFVQRTRKPLAAKPVNSSLKAKGSEGPAAKKIKIEEVKASDDDDDDDVLSQKSFDENETPPSARSVAFLRDEGEEASDDYDGDLPVLQHQTAFESCLPEVRIDKEAIEEYEALRSSQAEPEPSDGAASRLESRQWVRGKSSIYVDAFNLALDTVLEDEAHLFDEREKRVFEHWRQLTYEAQYLYVRLFLRKTATWHRVERLKYHNDISDVNQAISDLQEARDLPSEVSGDTLEQSSEDGQKWSLPEPFAFADDSDFCITTMDEAASLLSLDELKTLAKEAKVQGKTKAELQRELCRTSARQSGLAAVGLLRRSSTMGSEANSRNSSPSRRDESPDSRQDANRNAHFLTKILAITGPLIRLSEPVFKLFERVHLVFYRSTEWTEKSLTTIILAKISRRNFPEYIVCRSSNIFESRRHLLEFEHSMRQEFEVDKVLEFNGPPGEKGFQKVLDIFDSISTRWRELLKEEQHKEEKVYEFGEGAYLRRFNAAHAYTRIAHKAAYVMGRLHRPKEEHALLTEFLSQRLFHPARRGSWYQRKALLEEHYMWENDPNFAGADPDVAKKHWRRVALTTCETALEDRDCHLIYHYDLQKRLLKLEKRLRIPRRLQHDFGHVKLRQPEEHTVEGTQVVRNDPFGARKGGRPGGPSTKTIWLDELSEPPEEGGGPAKVSVEEMCLSHYKSQGWKGYHAEGGILRTLFAYLFFDVLFIYIPNVFQTAFQTCPLDLHTDAFYPTRTSEINHRLVEIANGEAEQILRRVHEREHERKTCMVGLNWDFEISDLLELVACFDGGALAAVCKVMAQDYKSRGAGVPDLVLWRPFKNDEEGDGEGGEGKKRGDEEGKSKGPKGEVMFAEVKSANDRLSDTQRLWIHVLTGAGVRVALCNAVARDVKVVD
ncbi:VRR-NUC domain-containing protein [Diplogelasinospora grovesii]|uniref:Fanconi-associated nuclease n=1 Tax=Diplogelasinospora grovesii TaxID=303347 RepID=A0AAN6S3J6_9PEZI|nr:VRR-NUC domain-containing protein [Diplogelasinospora grovesii]